VIGDMNSRGVVARARRHGARARGVSRTVTSGLWIIGMLDAVVSLFRDLFESRNTLAEGFFASEEIKQRSLAAVAQLEREGIPRRDALAAAKCVALARTRPARRRARTRRLGDSHRPFRGTWGER